MPLTPQLALYTAAGTTLAFLFTRKPVEKCPHAVAYGDCVAIPTVVYPGLTAPFVNSPEDCGGGNRVPAALVDQPPHSQPIGPKGHQDHA